MSETSVAGYSAGAWSCTGSGTQSGSSIALANGQSATCTIVNDDDKAAPSAATAMRWLLHDTATVSGIRPGAPDAASATITFRLYGPNDAACTTPINGGGEVRPAAGGAETHTITIP